MTTNTKPATFTKLRDDSWGIRIEGALPGLGDEITVKTKAGETKTVRVKSVVWSGNGVHVCAIQSDRPTGKSSGARRSTGGVGRCRECRGPLVSVPHHRAMGGLCGQCAFDEYDC